MIKDDLTAAERLCLSVYFKYHVSEVSNLDPHLNDAWVIGSELYSEIKQDRVS